MTTQRRRRAWADTLLATSIATGATTISNLLSGAPTMDTLTAVRIIGYLEFYGSELNETECDQMVDIGVGVSSAEAFNVGSTALPDPTTSGDYPPRGWLYVARRHALQTLPTGGTPTAMYRQNANFDFDVRGDRKVDKGILFMSIVSTQLGVASTTLDFIARIRVLCLT